MYLKDIGDFIKDEEPSKLVLQEECYSSHDTSFLYYLPEKIKEVCDKMRKVLKERRGKDKIFIFSYNGTFMDEIKVQLKEANKLVEFYKYAQGMEKDGQYGKQFMYSVKVDGDSAWSTT